VKIEKIAETIVGLKTYEVKIDDKKMKDYVEWTESHTSPNLNIWAFICGFILLILNLVGKSLKNAYEEEYAVRKVVESFYNMEIHQEFLAADGTSITNAQYDDLFNNPDTETEDLPE
jgi:hypothetical protein